MKHRRLGGLCKSATFIYLDAVKSKVNMLACLVSDESSLPCLQTAAFLLCPYMMEKE